MKMKAGENCTQLYINYSKTSACYRTVGYINVTYIPDKRSIYIATVPLQLLSRNALYKTGTKKSPIGVKLVVILKSKWANNYKHLKYYQGADSWLSFLNRGDFWMLSPLFTSGCATVIHHSGVNYAFKQTNKQYKYTRMTWKMNFFKVVYNIHSAIS